MTCIKMIKIILLFTFVLVRGHSDKIQDEGEMQSALMPQELNPAFVSDKDAPLRAIFPIRHRRDLYDPIPAYDSLTTVKTYSRIVTFVVLAVSALIEIIVYIIETFWII